MRDLDTHPYTKDEQRVANWLAERSGGNIGGGDDPIGFLLASYAYLHAMLHQEPDSEGTRKKVPKTEAEQCNWRN